MVKFNFLAAAAQIKPAVPAKENVVAVEKAAATVTPGEAPKMPAAEPAKPLTFSGFKFAKPVEKTTHADKMAEAAKSLQGSGLTKKLVEKQEALQRMETRALEKLTDADKDYLARAAKKIETEAPTDAEIEANKIPLLHIPHVPDLVLDPSQEAALKGLLDQRFGVLIGAAGTGKTTVTKVFVRRLQDSLPIININRGRRDNDPNKPKLNVAIAFAAFTGRAVQQMKKALPREYHPMCSTIHSLLGFEPVKEFNDGGNRRTIFRPTFDATNKLPFKIYIFDEAGMIPIPLWNQFMDACPEDARIYLIGDIQQLPPVQGRSVLGYAMVVWPTFELTQIHRQAADNPIIGAAWNILQGKYPLKAPGRIEIISLPDGQQAAQTKIIQGVQMLARAKHFDPFNDALIVPQNVGPLGQTTLNEHFLVPFNPPKKMLIDGREVKVNPREIVKAGRVTASFAIGDKVMLLQNDRERGLTNGMTGLVVKLYSNDRYTGSHENTVGVRTDEHATLDFSADDFMDIAAAADAAMKEAQAENNEGIDANQDDENLRQASHVMTVLFKNGDLEEEVEFATVGQYKRLAHAYAFTCHKSQGGEYPTVVIAIHSANSRMLTREWLYTAVTRAREKLIIMCNNRALAIALSRQSIKGKTLAEKIKSYNDLLDKKDTNLPDLPAPMLAANSEPFKYSKINRWHDDVEDEEIPF